MGLGKSKPSELSRILLTLLNLLFFSFMRLNKIDNDHVFNRIAKVGGLSNHDKISCICNGKGMVGDVDLYWTNDVTLNIIDSNNNNVYFYIVFDTNTNANWRGTSIYGYPQTSQKNSSNLINNLP